MRFRKITSMILAVILVFLSTQAVALAAVNDANDTMLHITDQGVINHSLAKGVNLTEGKTYVFTFRQKFTKGDIAFCDNGTGVAVGLFFVKNGALHATNRSTWREEWDDRRPIYQIIDSEKGIVSFTFTVEKHEWDGNSQTYPATGESAEFALGFNFNIRGEVDFYANDFCVYDITDQTKTNLFKTDNGSLNDWYSEKGAISGNSYSDTTNYYKVDVLPFDEAVFVPEIIIMDEPALPENMLYYRNDNSELIGCFTKPEFGKEYYYSFAIASNVKKEDIKIKGLTNGSARNIFDVSAKLVLAKQKSGYIWLTYSIKIPETIQTEEGVVFIGPILPAAETACIFNMYMYDPYLRTKSNLLLCDGFKRGLNDIALGTWTAQFPYWAFVDSPIEVKDCMTEWYDSSRSRLIKVVPFSLLGDSRMLRYKGSVNNKDSSFIGQKVTLTKGKTYRISFKYKAFEGKIDDSFYLAIGDWQNGVISKLFMGNCLDEPYKFQTQSGEDESTVEYSFELNGINIEEKSETDVYSLTFASFDKENQTDIYIADLVLYDSSDPFKTNLLSSDSNMPSLTGWGSGRGLEEDELCELITYNGYTLFNVKRKDNYFNPEKTMLHITERKVNGLNALAQKISVLEADKYYTVSFNYCTKSGKLNENFYFALFANNSKSTDGVVLKDTVRAAMNNGQKVFSSSSNNGVKVSYTFSLSNNEIGDNDNFYAGFYFTNSPQIVTELYISDLILYETDDIDKNNLFLSGDKEKYVTNWYSVYGASLGGKEAFSRPDTEFTAEYLPFSSDFFEKKEAVIHYGDGNADGVLDIRDLVNIKKRIAYMGAYYIPADINSDDALSSADLVCLKRHFTGIKEIVWMDYEISLLKSEKLSGYADSEAEELKSSILSAKDSISATGTRYYVSQDGNNTNDGKSPSAPIKINKVNGISLKSGDAVLFKRGDVFRTNTPIMPKNGVYYGAYGSGDKPQILGSIRDYADSSIWSSTDGNIWVTEIKSMEAANIIFNNGEATGVRKIGLDAVKTDGDFYFDSETSLLYLYLNQINPGNYFDSIEISSTKFIFQVGYAGGQTNNITIDNLCLKYSAVHALSLNYGENLTVKNCEIGWIGGGYYSGEVRLGNAIEFWDMAENNTVKNNYIYQIYDAALTFQGNLVNSYKNLTYQNNLIEYCSMNFEFWANEENNSNESSSDINAVIHNIDVSGNILRFGGYGWGAQQRVDKESQAFILTWGDKFTSEQLQNFNITNNIFDTANCNFLYSIHAYEVLNISGNSYYQKTGSFYQTVKNKSVYALDQASFEDAIAFIDSAPKSVEWY